MDAIDYFMRGNFSGYDRVLEKLEVIKVANIKNALNMEEKMLMQTEEEAFNDRFKSDAAGQSELMSDEENET